MFKFIHNNIRRSIITLYQRMQIELQRLQSNITQIQSQISELPNGNLICARNENRFKWYLSHNHQITYLPRKKRSLAEKLAIKKYLTLVLQELNQKKAAIETFLHQYPSGTPEAIKPTKSETLLTEESGFRELLLPYFQPASEQLLQWMNAHYESNQKYPEQLIHKSPSGNFVRSKSEVMIDMYLFTHHIPFRYESALTLGEVTLFPDFTIFHPNTNKIYYWEHFGRMDDTNYSKNVFSKLQLYNTHGITPGIQLITTYETAENPLTFDTIENIVSFYFAC